MITLIFYGFTDKLWDKFKNLTYLCFVKSFNNIKKFSIALLFIMVVKLAIASVTFTGINEDRLKGNKYSLKNFSSMHHTLSLSTLKYSLHYTSSDVYSFSNSHNSVQMNSMMRYDRGNTTYIMPFNYKVKVPKFKTPSANN